MDVGKGWVAVCVGSKAGERGHKNDEEPCGFSMPLAAYRWVNHVGLVPEESKPEMRTPHV